MDVSIKEIENIVIKQAGSTYRLIHEEGNWIFVNLDSGARFTGYTKKGAYDQVTKANTTILEVPGKIKIHELWV